MFFNKGSLIKKNNFHTIYIYSLNNLIGFVSTLKNKTYTSKKN